MVSVVLLLARLRLRRLLRLGLILMLWGQMECHWGTMLLRRWLLLLLLLLLLLREGLVMLLRMHRVHHLRLVRGCSGECQLLRCADMLLELLKVGRMVLRRGGRTLSLGVRRRIRDQHHRRGAGRGIAIAALLHVHVMGVRRWHLVHDGGRCGRQRRRRWLMMRGARRQHHCLAEAARLLNPNDGAAPVAVRGRRRGPPGEIWLRRGSGGVGCAVLRLLLLGGGGGGRRGGAGATRAEHLGGVAAPLPSDAHALAAVGEVLLVLVVHAEARGGERVELEQRGAARPVMRYGVGPAVGGAVLPPGVNELHAAELSVAPEVLAHARFVDVVG